MPRKRHSAEQIVTKLRQIEVLVAQGRTIGSIYQIVATVGPAL